MKERRQVSKTKEVDENKKEVEQKSKEEVILFPCKPLNWLGVDRRIRYILGWIYFRLKFLKTNINN